MLDDTELLRRFAQNRSNEAFTELVQRHVDFVYATAVRNLGGDGHAAIDVCQYVFGEVARRPSSLMKFRTLKGWLYTTALRASCNVLRSNRRREARELAAHDMIQGQNAPAEAFTPSDLRETIDIGLAALNNAERELVFLRYLEECGYEEIGARFSISADAVRLRTDRAIEKMRRAFSRKGVTSTATAIAGTLTAQARVFAPPGSSNAIAMSALRIAASGAIANSLTSMSAIKVQYSIIGACLAVGLLGTALQQALRLHWRDELASLRQQNRVAVRLKNANARLQEPPQPGVQTASDRLKQLRDDTAALRAKIDAAAMPLSPGLIRSETWQNVGKDSPAAAMETLLWAAAHAEFETVAKMVEFDPTVRLAADAMFPFMPDAVRRVGNISSVEEMAGFAWAVGAELSGARVLGIAESPSVDDVVLIVQLQRSDGEVRSIAFPFHRSADGWHWVLSHQNFDYIGAGIGNVSRRLRIQK